MITSLLFTTTGNLILGLFIAGILFWCIWTAAQVQWDRKELLLSLRKQSDPFWPWRLSFLENRTIWKRHIAARLFCRDWKELYRPGFFADDNFIPRDEP